MKETILSFTTISVFPSEIIVAETDCLTDESSVMMRKNALKEKQVEDCIGGATRRKRYDAVKKLLHHFYAAPD